MATVRPTLPPGPRMPGAVQGIQFLLKEFELLERCRKRYGDVFTLRMWPFGELVVLSDPALLKDVFTQPPTTLHAGEGNGTFEPMVGPRSIMMLDEDPHLEQRKLLSPPMHGDRMRVYADLMREIADEQIEQWQLGSTFKLLPSFQAIALRVIIRAVFGVDRARDVERLETLILRMIELGDWVTMLPLLRRDLGRRSPWGRFLRARAAADAVIYEHLAKRRSEESGDRSDVLSLLLRARHADGRPMSDQELRDELMTLLIAGHATTAAATAWSMERILRHPPVLDRLRAELHSDHDQYLSSVITEVLRCRPVISFAVRQVKRPASVGSWTIDPGVVVGSSAYLTHTRPDVYPDPFTFRPERFEQEAPGTYSYVAFGGGIRRCLGSAFARFETQVVVRRILERCTFSLPDPAPEPERRQGVVHQPARGARVRLESRT
ncbi:MAG: cytochrome P450 [Thermoleophilaceae bacterium]